MVSLPQSWEDVMMPGLRRWKGRAANSERNCRTAFLMGKKETPTRGVSGQRSQMARPDKCMSIHRLNTPARKFSLSIHICTDHLHIQRSVAVKYLLSELPHLLFISLRYRLLSAGSRKDIYYSWIRKRQCRNCFYRGCEI